MGLFLPLVPDLLLEGEREREWGMWCVKKISTDTSRKIIA